MMDQLLIARGFEYHPDCDPKILMDQRNAELRQKIIDVITWVDENSHRSMQVEIGPSEMGHPCDQHIARVLAGMPRVNHNRDPWPAIVGTSIHTWLEKAVGSYQEGVFDEEVQAWRTEVAMMFDDMIPAHSDLYTHDADVVDWKTKSVAEMAKMHKHGPDEQARIQGHCYGYAHERAGRPVRDIVLVFLPRSGNLKDIYLWRESYDRRVAINASRRVYGIGNELIRLDVVNDPAMWAQVPTVPGEQCWVCPYFVSHKPNDEGPDGKGCPGRNGSAEEMQVAAEERFGKGLVAPKGSKGK
jgi:hypothetical protein